MITAELLMQVPLFAGTPETERTSIAAHAADLYLRAGEWLLLEGELPAFFVLLEGRMEVLKRMGEHDQRLTFYQPGDYFGEVPLLLGAPAIASLRAASPRACCGWSPRTSASWWRSAPCSPKRWCVP